jgi:hypothetical protein
MQTASIIQHEGKILLVTVEDAKPTSILTMDPAYAERVAINLLSEARDVVRRAFEARLASLEAALAPVSAAPGPSIESKPNE